MPAIFAYRLFYDAFYITAQRDVCRSFELRYVDVERRYVSIPAGLFHAAAMLLIAMPAC